MAALDICPTASDVHLWLIVRPRVCNVSKPFAVNPLNLEIDCENLLKLVVMVGASV